MLWLGCCPGAELSMMIRAAALAVMPAGSHRRSPAAPARALQQLLRCLRACTPSSSKVPFWRCGRVLAFTDVLVRQGDAPAHYLPETKIFENPF